MNTKKNNSSSNSNNYVNNALEQFAEVLIGKLEKMQKSDWKCPWFTAGSMTRPVNLRGTGYNGSNSIMLMIWQENLKYELPVWGTFKQYLELTKKGEEQPVCVNRGEKSLPVFYTSYAAVNKSTGERITIDEYKRLPEADKEEWKVVTHTSVYHVFNIAQTNMETTRPDLYAKYKTMYGATQPEAVVGNSFEIPAADAMLTSQSWICPIELEYQGSAFYNFAKDFIRIPQRRQFTEGEAFYGTLFHEMAHSTGSDKYLKRNLQTADRDAYGREELVAEMTAAFVLSGLGVVKYIKDDSIQYLKSWIDTIKETPEVLKTILSDVRKAAALIEDHLGRSGEVRQAA